MADPRRFWSAPASGDDTQIQVQAIGQGATRQEATFIQGSDVPPFIPDGDYDGQPAAWSAGDQAWLGLPLGQSLVYRGWASDAQCLVEPATDFSVIAPGELTLSAGAAASVLAMTSLATTLQTPLFRATCNAVGGQVEAISENVDMLLSTIFSVILGEGGQQFTLTDGVGSYLQVEQGAAIIQNNGGACIATVETDAHVFQVPDATGNAPIANVEFGHVGNAPTAGFLGAAPVVRQTVSPLTSNREALNSLIAGLAALGLVNPATVPALASVKLLNWNPATVVMQLMPAGHAPGFYLLSLNTIVRVGGGTAAAARSYQYSNGGAQTMATFGTSQNLTVVGPVPGNSSLTPSCSIFSDGISAINLTLTVTGAPAVGTLVDVVAQALFMGT